MKKLQKLLGIDLRYVIKHGGVVSLSHAIGTGLGFVVTYLLANFVDQTTYGQYKYIVSIAGVLGACTLNGAASAVLQSVSKGYEGSLKIETRNYMVWSTPALILAIILGTYYIVMDDPVLGSAIILMTVINYIQNIYLLHVSFLNGKKDFTRLATNQIINASVVALAIFGITMLEMTHVIVIILAYHGSQMLFQIWAHRKTLKRHTPQPEVLETETHLSRHLSLGNMVVIVSEFIDKILIFQLLGPQKLALYAFSVGIPDQMRSINKVIKAILIPKLNTKTNPELSASVHTHTRTYVLITVLITILFAFLATPIYKLLFPQYVAAAPYASFYMLMLPIIAFGMLHGEALQIKGMIKEIYFIRFLEPISKIALLVICIPHFGIAGAIGAILTAKSIAIGLQIFFFLRSEKKIT